MAILPGEAAGQIPSAYRQTVHVIGTLCSTVLETGEEREWTRYACCTQHDSTEHTTLLFSPFEVSMLYPCGCFTRNTSMRARILSFHVSSLLKAVRRDVADSRPKTDGEEMRIRKNLG